ncbi:MAG: radical SAM protein [Acidobacteria bacterium]|nr:radical SAM protein [Acidobacteriota bacterium]
MQVTEIFRSIQGESTFAGLPCIFIRLTGCNLRCVWCDTAYAFYGGKKMSAQEILAAVREMSNRSEGKPVKLVEVTGGEPLLQKEIYPLIDRLLAGGYQVLIETSGERPIRDLPSPVVRVVDVKCPGSGEGGSFLLENLEHLASHDQLKFVLADRRDYEWAREFLQEHRLQDKVETVIFSPVFGKMEPRPLAEWILADGLPVRVGLQLHKFIWDPEATGV